ncbi:MAG: MarR family winged helix-turn-helix transcriptional regulator, partial [Caulobacterales bacterium]|nr:MarR family winged helix-turn-helix transcriptional regulator [Caulobacterales bacterium]
MTATAQGAGYDLADSPSHLLHRAQQFAADRFADEMNGAALTQRQFAVLSAVAANEGLTQTDLVRATGIDRSTLAELVGRMSERTLLRRARAKTDGRANTVSLTARGRSMFEEMRTRVERADARILDALPKNKRAAFLDVLQRFDRLLEDDVVETIVKEKPDEKRDKEPKKKKDKGKKTTAKATKKPGKVKRAAKVTKTVKAETASKPAKGGA